MAAKKSGARKRPQQRTRKSSAKQPEDTRLVIDVPEAGSKLGLSRNAAYDAARRGEIPTIRFGKLLKVPRAAFERMLADVGRPKTKPAA